MTPQVSVIMPVRNEGRYITPCLEAVFAQDYPPQAVEIIVVDGASDDDTAHQVRALQARHPNLRLVENPARITPVSLNLGIAHARGEIILRVDGHCRIAPDYIRRCVHHLQKDRVEGVGGPIQTIGEDALSETIAVSMSAPFGVGDSAFRTVSGATLQVDTVPFAAYPIQVMRKHGLYDQELVRNQDDEYNFRIRAAGGRILLAADVRSVYYSRGSLPKLWRQYYQYGFYKVRVLQKHPRQMSLRQFVPPAFVLALLVTALLAILAPWGWAAFALVAASYLAANLVAALITASRRGWQHLALLPVCFAILHVSYGLGFLAGLIRFAARWGDRRGHVPAWPPATGDTHP